MNGKRAQFSPIQDRGPIDLADALLQGDVFRSGKSNQSLELL